MRINLRGLFNKVTSPKAFTTYALIGVGVTITMAILNTRKQCKYEYDKKSQEENSENVVEEIKTTVNNYAPTIISAVATVYCINKAETKWIDYNGMLSAGIMTAQNKMEKLRASVPGLAAAELIHGFGGQKAEEGKRWFCVKGYAGEPDVYFQSTIADVIYAEYCLNRNFHMRGSASVREFYAFLDILDQCPMKYEYLGWDYSYMENECNPEFIWIDFKHEYAVDPESGEEITEIRYTWSPIYSQDNMPYSNPWEYMPHSYNSPHE